MGCAAVLFPLAPRSEVLGFYGGFLPKASVYVNGEGEYVYASTAGEVQLKFADRLEFSNRQAIEIDIRGAEKSRIDYSITALTEPWVSVKGSCLLIKYIDGAWYIAERFTGGSPSGFVINPSSTDTGHHEFNKPQHWWYILFFCDAWGLGGTTRDMLGKRLYTLPSGRYALFVPADRTVRKAPDGTLVAEGLGMVEFDLINLEDEPRSITVEELSGTVYESMGEYYMTWGDYRVENVSDTLYFDPYK